MAPHDRGLARTARVGGIVVERFRYAPDRLERLAYRGGLLTAVRSPLGLVLVPLFLLSFLVASLRSVRRMQPDLIHAHWWFPAGLIAWITSRLTGVPFVVTLHGSDVGLLGRVGFRWLGRRVLGGAAVVGAVSQAMADAAVATVGRRDIALLRMPVEVVVDGGIAPFPPRPPLRLLAVGRLSPEKGFEDLIVAVSRVASAGVVVELDLVGAGPLHRRLARMAEAAPCRVTLHLPCTRRELWSLMQDAHAVVVPSRAEGLGLVAIEALALGRPVVASRVGGLPEAVADGVDGTLVEAGNTAALAEALTNLPVLVPLGAAVRAHAPRAVMQAHDDAYQMARATVVERRWRPMRPIGAILALVAIAAITRAIARDWAQVRNAISGADRAWVGALIAASVAAELGFALASAAVLRGIEGRVVPRRHAAAGFLVTQNAKHLPGAIWPAVARLGLARKWGLDRAATFSWLAVESLASSAAGLAVGGVAYALGRDCTDCTLAVGNDLSVELHPLGIVFAVAGLLLPAVAWRRLPPARLARRWGTDLAGPWRTAWLSLRYVPVWALAGAVNATAARSLAPGLPDSAILAVGGAAAVASVIGFLAIPVPAGLGVREAVFAAMVSTVLPVGLALAVALLARAVSTLVQVALGAAALPMIRGLLPRNGWEES